MTEEWVLPGKEPGVNYRVQLFIPDQPPQSEAGYQLFICWMEIIILDWVLMSYVINLIICSRLEWIRQLLQG